MSNSGTDSDSLRGEVMRLRTAIRQQTLPDGHIVVTGRPGGDGECWHFEVTEEEYRRIVGEEHFQVEKKWRDKGLSEIYFPAPGYWTLGPSDLLMAAGVESTPLITLSIQVRLNETIRQAPLM
jgi:hypothetical protein